MMEEKYLALRGRDLRGLKDKALKDSFPISRDACFKFLNYMGHYGEKEVQTHLLMLKIWILGVVFHRLYCKTIFS